MSAVLAQNDRTVRRGGMSWLVMGVGVLTGLVLVAVITTLLMQPPLAELATLIGTLAVTAVVSLAVGYALYRRGWARSPSLMFTLALAYVWAAVLTLFNVWVMAWLMFADAHDLTLAGVLLLFAAIIATTFGVFVAASVSDGLRQLAGAANQLAAGNLNARADVTGRDEISQVAASFNDMAAQLQQAEQERRELETLRRDLIAWTSHDLRTPLTSMRVMVEALHDGIVEDDATRQRYYRTIRAEVIALNGLIDDLFELAQLDAGGLKLEMASVSLADLISDTIEGFRPLCEQRDIELVGRVGPDLELVTMDASRIGRVLSNLINNAFQHTSSGGRVEVLAGREQHEVVVTVTDGGPGFSAEDLPRVFERFYRGEQARSRATGGAGLGLAIASGIVAAHGGRIWAENVIGDGDQADVEGAVVGFAIPQ
ncbi:MAG: HAMP domain-containing protein [Chloroflexota bacterium]|nr:MAG: HAMP domain-containing protein [Chloroflexota bacterium]